MKNKIEIGDRIRFKIGCRFINGKVVSKEERFKSVGIESENELENGHTCAGFCRDGFGIFVHESYLEKV